MFVMKGKYNIAKIMLPFSTIEEAILSKSFDEPSKNQIQTFLNHPAFQGEPICIMPDCHFGKGSVIGFTMKLNDYIIPNIVGVDLGCGMLSYNLGTMIIPLEELDHWVHENIPVGKNVYNHKNSVQWVCDKMDNILGTSRLFASSISNISKQINPEKEKYFFNSLGTLGGGNHFLELGEDEQGNKWLTIHSGSRNFGLQIASFYQKTAIELCSSFFREEKDLAFLPISHAIGNDYIEAMKVAQKYASLNRYIVLQRIVEGFLKKSFNPNTTIESIHNYIDFDDRIIRKGAISAQKDKEVIIPFNMEEGLIIGIGKGNKEWNYSAPHGAGRIMSRTKAKEILNLKEAKDLMNKAGIYTTSLNASTLDEVKGAYKDKNIILDTIKETVEIKSFVKPIWNLKAGE